MDEISIKIPADTTSDASENLVEGGARTIENCCWRIKTFVERDAYVGYDHASHGLPKNVITREHIRLINSKMRARSPIKAWADLFCEEFEELSRIPDGLDLIDSGDAEIKPALEALAKLIGRLSAVKYLTDMAPSKALHLLRPRFIAISDSYVRGGLSLNILPRPNDTYYARRMIAIQRKIRELGLQNKTELEQLSQYANSLSVSVQGAGKVPVCLTKVRILDILLWTDPAVRDHPYWSCWYRSEIQGIQE